MTEEEKFELTNEIIRSVAPYFIGKPEHEQRSLMYRVAVDLFSMSLAELGKKDQMDLLDIFFGHMKHRIEEFDKMKRAKVH